MNSIWQRLIAGQLMHRELPKKLDLSDILVDMDRLWQLTAQDCQERGACIGLDQGRLRLVHEVVGTPTGVNPMHRVGDYNDHLGFFHTHSLDPDGFKQTGFSDRDFAGVLEDGDRVAIVRSYNEVFALVRTERTRPPAPVSNQEVDEFLAVFQYYDARPGLTLSEARRRVKVQRWANYDLCCQLGFAFYTGKFGQPLKRKLTPSLLWKLIILLRRKLMP